MNNSSDYILTLKLASNYTTVQLPYTISGGISKLKILSMQYTTAAAGYTIMAVKVSGYNNNVYFDGTNTVGLVKTIYMSNAANSSMEYNPIDSNPDVIINNANNTQIRNIHVEILIDSGAGFQYQGVNSSYPLYLELKIY